MDLWSLAYLIEEGEIKCCGVIVIFGRENECIPCPYNRLQYRCIQKYIQNDMNNMISVLRIKTDESITAENNERKS